MTIFLIVIIVAVFWWWADSTNAKTNMRNDREKNGGSRQVDKEEWERHLRLLCDEYCELAGITVDFESAGIDPFKVERNGNETGYIKWVKIGGEVGFGVPLKVFGTSPRFSDKKYDNIPMFTDRTILEKLRAKHGLPSDYELNGTIYGNKDGSTNYKSLFSIMEKCVHRAVRERGYRYGGTDYAEERRRELNLKALENKYDYYNHNKKK